MECSGKYQTSSTQGAPQAPTHGPASISRMRTACLLVFLQSISQLRNPRLDLPQRRKARLNDLSKKTKKDDKVLWSINQKEVFDSLNFFFCKLIRKRTHEVQLSYYNIILKLKSGLLLANPIRQFSVIAINKRLIFFSMLRISGTWSALRSGGGWNTSLW